jgi:restriction endonuclease S subunit
MKKTWQRKVLGDLFQTGSGGTPLKAKKEFYDGGTIPWLMSGEVSHGDVRAATRFITQKGLKNSAAKIFPKDTVLVAMYGATAGQVGILRFEAATNQAVCGILPNKHFVPEFLFYFLLSKKDELVAQATGNAQPNISQIKIRNTEVPIAPLSEQQRIVGILDEAFDDIATARANAEKNLQNARALFESHLQSVLAHRGPNWMEKTVEEISTNLDSKRIPITKSDRKSGKYPYYGASGIVDYVADYIFEGDMLLVSEDGANLLMRSTPIAFSVSGKYWVNNHAHILKFENMATQQFVEFYLANIKLDEYIRGAAQPKLTQKALNSIPIPIPKSVEAQAKIVESLESLQEETQRLESIYRQKLAALDALKKSLLHRAFSGHL